MTQHLSSQFSNRIDKLSKASLRFLSGLIRTFNSKPVIATYVCALVLLSISLITTHLRRSYNSDDLSWQAILLHWRPFSGDHVYLGSTDNFIDKLPFFALLEHFFTPGRKLLFVESYILGVGGFTCFYVSSIYFLKKLRIKLSLTTLSPFLWLSGFGFSFAQLYLTPMWRVPEVGLSFVTFALVAMYYYKDVMSFDSMRGKLFTLLAVAIAGFISYSDPYYLYFTLGPIVLLSIIATILKIVPRRKALVVLASVLGSLLFYKLTGYFAEHVMGFQMVATYPAQFTDVENLVSNTLTSFHGLLVIYGGDFFGRVISRHISLVAEFINALLLGIIIYRIAILRHEPVAKNRLDRLWITFFGLLVPFVFLVYSTSTLVDVATYRYFFILVLSSVLFLSITLGVSRPRFAQSVALLLLIATALNITVSVRGAAGYSEPGDYGGNVRNYINYQLIDAVRSHHLAKGYANYWQGNINTYLSKGQISFLPTQCDQGKTIRDYWLISKSSFEQSSQNSFFVIDPDIPQPPTCTKDEVVAQFGNPQDSFTIADKTVLIYNYDIITRM